jgi:hypothetical protein
MPCNASYASFIFGKFFTSTIYFWKVFHKYYNFICAPICTKSFIFFLQKVGVTTVEDSDAAREDVTAAPPRTRSLT